MSRLARDRTAERVSRDQTLRREREQTGKYLFSLFSWHMPDFTTSSVVGRKGGDLSVKECNTFTQFCW